MCTPRESELMWNFSLVVAHCMTSQDFGAGCSWEFWMSGQLQCTHTNTHTHTHTHTYKQTHKQTHTLWAIQQPFYRPEEVLQGALSQWSRVQSLWPLTFHAWACGLFCTCQCCASLHESLEFTQGWEWISLLVVFGNADYIYFIYTASVNLQRCLPVICWLLLWSPEFGIIATSILVFLSVFWRVFCQKWSAKFGPESRWLHKVATPLNIPSFIICILL